VRGACLECQQQRPGRRGEWSRVTNGLIVFALAAVVGIAIYSGGVASPVGRADSWRVASGLNGMFTVQAPVGWHVIEAAVGGSDGAYIMVIERSQWVRAYVAVYPELVADTQTWGQTSGGGQTQTLLQVHLISERIWTEYFGSINSGPPVRTIINGRPAVWSRMQFVDDGRNYSGLGMTGMRMTLTHGQVGVLLAAVAPDDSWDEFEPIALRILKSIRLNQGVGRRPASATQRAPAR
jgi:hypothetical protein